MDGQYLDVDELNQTSNANIYAVGDIINKPNLTPVAIEQGLLQFVLNDVCASIEVQLDVDQTTSSTSMQFKFGLLLESKKMKFKLFPFFTFRQVN